MHLVFINGFLGSGKTTLMNHLLSQGEKMGVIVNDFGDTNLDSQLIHNEGAMIQIENGSIFCSCNSHQFVESLISMSKEDLNILLIESSGFSNPGSLNNVVNQLVELGQLEFDSIHKITIVDPVLYKKTKRLLPVMRQIDVADVLVINKTDLVNQDELDELRKELISLNPEAKIITTQYSKIDLNEVMGHQFTNEFVSYETSRDVSLNSISLPLHDESVSKQTVIESLENVKESVFRVKGFMIVDQKPSLVELASERITIQEIENFDEELVLVILYSIKNIGQKEIFRRLSSLPIHI